MGTWLRFGGFPGGCFQLLSLSSLCLSRWGVTRTLLERTVCRLYQKERYSPLPFGKERVTDSRQDDKDQLL